MTILVDAIRSLSHFSYSQSIISQVKRCIRPLIAALILMFTGTAYAEIDIGLFIQNDIDSNGNISVVNGGKVKVGYEVFQDDDKELNKADKIQLLRVEDDGIVSSVLRGKKKSGSISLKVKNSEDEQLYVRYIRKGKAAEVVATVSKPGDPGFVPLVSIAKASLADLTVRLNAADIRYAIGDKGPAGGWVFYVTADGLHGLEAAPVDQAIPFAPGAVWGCRGTDLSGTDGTALGTGAPNTADIIRDCPDLGIAARLADEYVSPDGYFDWYLPSKDELKLMYLNIGAGSAPPVNVGGFVSNSYWSSSEFDGDDAWYKSFVSGASFSTDKNLPVGVRAVRAF